VDQQDLQEPLSDVALESEVKEDIRGEEVKQIEESNVE
jgi:hypothetical protein